MSNFWKDKVAQESLFVEDAVYSLTPEEESLMIAEAESKVNELDHDLELLDDDTDRLVACMHVRPGLKSVLVAQESIRKRWGIAEHVMVGQEGLASDLKAMITRFIAWLREKAFAAKDLWFKFYNTGKSIKRRSAKYKVQIFKCHRRNKDFVSGRFIERLMVGSSFVGADVPQLKLLMGGAKEAINAQSRITDAIVASVTKDLAGGTPNYAHALSQDALYGSDTKPFPILGHRTLFAESTADDNDGYFARLSFPPTLKEDVPPSVFTPKLQALERINDFYYLLGRELEREITKAQFVEKTHLKIANTMSNLLKTIDSAQNNPEKLEAAKRAARYARYATSKSATIASVSMFTWRNLAGGLGGFIQESIRAFS